MQLSKHMNMAGQLALEQICTNVCLCSRHAEMAPFLFCFSLMHTYMQHACHVVATQAGSAL